MKGRGTMAESARSSTAGVDANPETTETWLRRAAALTVAPPPGWPDDEVAAATGTATALAAIARSLLESDLVRPEVCLGSCPSCAASGGSCALLRDLAMTLPGTVPSPPMVDVAMYRRALAAAGGAVFTCRRTFHPSGACLFGPGDLCGRVLAAAHRLG
jgi:hypothetical protein